MTATATMSACIDCNAAESDDFETLGWWQAAVVKAVIILKNVEDRVAFEFIFQENYPL